LSVKNKIATFVLKLVVKAQFLKIDIQGTHGLLGKLAELLGTTTEKGYLKIPEKKGKGYLRGFLLGNSIGMMIRNCELYDDILTRRTSTPAPYDRIIMSFNNVFPVKDIADGQTNIQNLPSVQIGKGRLHFEAFYPSHTNFRSIILVIDAPNLKELLGVQVENQVLKTITESDQPMIFEEFISPQIQKVAVEIAENDIPEALHSFYYRLKAEELICLLFAELLKRENTSIQALNEIDAEKIYKVRDKILAQLSTPPALDDLVKEVGMSKSKLKRLFKQIFGESIFNYYQNFRMREAARLLKEHKLTVSEVGYEMGFSNLSHFTRVFEQHIGMKPKKFSQQ
jgi:AraC-like DNA-binding protein